MDSDHLDYDLIIPAAGSGSRMQIDVPKPFIALGERDILEHSLFAFVPQLPKRVIIATSTQYFEHISSYTFFKTYPKVELILVEGGGQRHESVANALQKVSADWVAVHDAVRPFFSANMLERLTASVQKFGSAIPAIRPRDTIKETSAHQIVRTLERSSLVQVQTPQFFRTLIYKTAMDQLSPDQLYTDDASILEQAGFSVYWVEGEQKNIKITFKEDLHFAQWVLGQ